MDKKPGRVSTTMKALAVVPLVTGVVLLFLPSSSAGGSNGATVASMFLLLLTVNFYSFAKIFETQEYIAGIEKRLMSLQPQEQVSSSPK